RDALVGLFGALPNGLAVPVELVPPVIGSLLLVDRHYLPPFFACFLASSLRGLPPSLPHSRSWAFEYRAARFLPPIEPVRRKYSFTASGMKKTFKCIHLMIT